ncbi:MAG: nitroreductase family protein, partial [Thermotogota bacterium]
MNTIIEGLMNRKSVRVFEKKEISRENKELILKAAAAAPTAGNQQLYTILDITDQALKDKLAITCDNQPFIATAPLVLIFCADVKK